MTFLEKLQQDHPDWDDYEVFATVRNTCPWNFGYESADSEEAKEFCTRDIQSVKCLGCWKRTMPEPDSEPTNDIDIYQKKALRTCSTTNEDEMLLEGVMGLCGEAGECIDIYKKFRFQGHTLGRAHFAEELGDVAWYLAVAAKGAGYKLSDIFNMNIKKLEKRYPAGFEADRSVNREE